MPSEATWSTARRLALKAVLVADEDRAAWIAEQCGGNPELLDLVERKVAQACADGPIQNPVFELLGTPRETTPDRYRIVERIGSGGMGTVYRAERSDGAVAKTVALKVMHLGMNSSEFLRRFEAERDTIANLEHPGIARLHDAGQLEDGRPYLAMELVEGQPLDRYCVSQKLGQTQRLQLFLRVCEAIEYLHARRVIHRDLKPRNILVTDDDHPKVVDFGVAKLLDDQHEGATSERAPLTPLYASPEQLRAEKQLETACDVYSLGVVLCELVAGESPYGPDAEKETATQLALSKDPLQLPRSLNPEMRSILRKALEKKSSQRYRSAGALGDDISRYLAGKTVAAHGDQSWYVLRKLVENHKVTALLAIGLLVTLIAFGTATRWQLQQTQTQRDLAEQGRTRSERVRQLLVDVFKAADPGVAKGESLSAIEALASGTDKVIEDLESESELQADLFLVLAEIHQNLGDYDRSESLIRRSLDLLPPSSLNRAVALDGLGELDYYRGNYEAARESWLQARPLHSDGTLDQAKNLSNLGLVEMELGNTDLAQPLLEESLRIRRQHPVEESLVDYTLNNLAGLHRDLEKFEQAEEFARETLEIRLGLHGPQHPDVGIAYNNLGYLYKVQGRLDAAIRYYRLSLEIDRHVLGDDHPDLAISLSNLALALRDLGQYKEAEEALRETAEIDKVALGEKSVYYGLDLVSLGSVLTHLGHLAEAEDTIRAGIAIYDESLAPNHRYRGLALGHLGDNYEAQGRRQEALDLMRQALQDLEGATNAKSHDLETARSRLEELEADIPGR